MDIRTSYLVSAILTSDRGNTDEDPDTLCLYPSKLCENPRVVKRNGELHRFCEYHRKRANENQRQQDEIHKERVVAQEKMNQSAIHPLYHPARNNYPADYHEQLPSLFSSLDFDEEDLRVLAEILFDEDSDVVRGEAHHVPAVFFTNVLL